MRKNIRKKDFLDIIKNCAEQSSCSSTIEIVQNHNFSPAGTVYKLNRDDLNGFFWCYECSDFIIDIHKFNIIEESFTSTPKNLDMYGEFFSTYILKGSGEIFCPYQKLSSGSMYAMATDSSRTNYILHKNTPFISVEICFRRPFLEKHINYSTKSDRLKTKEMFINTGSNINTRMRNISLEIINCKMDSPAADIFFEAKAKEWLSLILDAYCKNHNNMPIQDSEALSSVAQYIDHHYAMNISQKSLENISMMSGTKLKAGFKKKYGMTITEYTQRQRISAAEVLIINTDLSLKEIAKAVGYNSHSRFTQLFKRYNNYCPSDLKKNDLRR